ncbi:MAG: hypothetical protein J1E85_00065 [Ruminococcus sp.]|nr:hypothetical protein [Ruminococcus sp.]
METKKQPKRKNRLTKIFSVTSTVLCTIAMTMQSYSAAPPTGVDSSSYSSLVDIVFWIAGIAVAAAGGIPSIIKIVQGQADEDPRGRNAGIAGAVITGACVGALVAIKTILF